MPAENFDVTAARYAPANLVAFFADFFAAKNARDLARTMSFFSPDLVTYTDATLGWDLAGFEALRALYADYMPRWSSAAYSQPTGIFGTANRALLAFTDSPELFGSELRIWGVVDVAGGKIVRWVDYWDGRTMPAALYHQLQTRPVHPIRRLADGFPALASSTGPLAEAFSQGHAAALVAALAEEAIFEDLPLHVSLRGRAAIAHFLTGALSQLPYGHGSRWADPLPATGSGGAEWTASPAWPSVRGLLAIGRDTSGQIERLAVMYDGRLTQDEQLLSLLRAVISPR